MLAANTLFPLPLTAFERYMLADDRPSHPMAFAVKLRLGGQVGRDLFERSLRYALGRHPLLHALIDSADRYHPYWIPAGDLPPDVDWDTAAAPLKCTPSVSIDLTSRPGLRVWVRQGEREAEVTFEFHHACCDGLGAARFIGDILAAYGIHCDGQHDKPVPLPVDLKRLTMRGRLGRGDESISDQIFALLGTLPHVIRFSGRTPIPLSDPADPPPQSVPADTTAANEDPLLPPIEQHVFSVSQTERLREFATRHKATLNDILMRDMFLAIDEWNSRADGRQQGWLRILMPTSLRVVADDQMPASNIVSLSFLTRRASECDDPAGLLAGIQRETASIKRINRGLCFIRFIEMAQAIRGEMPLMLLGSRCRGTTVLSNLGHIERVLAATFPHESGRIVAGNLTLESIIAAPPIRPKTPAAFMAHCYAGQLNIGGLFDQNIFSRQQSQDFLRLYADKLLKTAEFNGKL